MYTIDGKFIIRNLQKFSKSILIEKYDNTYNYGSPASFDDSDSNNELFELKFSDDGTKVFLEKNPSINIDGIQWQRIIYDGVTTQTVNINNLISNPTSSDLYYTLDSNDYGNKIGVRVTYSGIKDLATNQIDFPEPDIFIDSDSDLVIGSEIFSYISNLDSASNSYSWKYSDNSDTGWIDITGGNTDNLVITSLLLGKYVKLVVNDIYESNIIFIPGPLFASITYETDTFSLLKLIANTNIENPKYDWMLNNIEIGYNDKEYLININDSDFDNEDEYTVKVTNIDDSSITETSDVFKYSTYLT